MKNYTLSWRSRSSWNKGCLCRCRWSPSAVLWPESAFDALSAFLEFSYFFVGHDCRLTRSGVLVARQATYQGV